MVTRKISFKDLNEGEQRFINDNFLLQNKKEVLMPLKNKAIDSLIEKQVIEISPSYEEPLCWSISLKADVEIDEKTKIA